MSAREFEEWKAYYRVEPFGDDWMQTGMQVAATLAPYSKRRLNPTDFIPQARQAMTPEQERARLKQWADAHNRRRNKERN